MAAKAGKTKKSTQRKLTAILCADVVGYSRLMGDDEEATIETLTAYRKDLSNHIQQLLRWLRGVGRRQCSRYLAIALLLTWGGLPVGVAQAARLNLPVKIGVLTLSWGTTPATEGLREGLVALGYRDNVDFVIGVRFTQGNTRALIPAAKALAVDADIIFTTDTAITVKAARTSAPKTPIVFIGVDDPVKSGLVNSFAHPGGTITGVATLGTELGPKRLELFRKIVPGLKRVLFIYDINNADSLAEAQVYRAAAPGLGLTLVERGVRTEADARASLAAFREGEIGGIVSPPSVSLNLFGVVLEAASQFPTMFNDSFLVEEGGLASYGRDRRDAGRQAARMVDKIIKGINPGDIPVEVNTKIELAINLKIAKALGLEVPPLVLYRADKIIR